MKKISIKSCAECSFCRGKVTDHLLFYRCLKSDGRTISNRSIIQSWCRLEDDTTIDDTKEGFNLMQNRIQSLEKLVQMVCDMIGEEPELNTPDVYMANTHILEKLHQLQKD